MMNNEKNVVLSVQPAIRDGGGDTALSLPLIWKRRFFSVVIVLIATMEPDLGELVQVTQGKCGRLGLLFRPGSVRQAQPDRSSSRNRREENVFDGKKRGGACSPSLSGGSHAS